MFKYARVAVASFYWEGVLSQTCQPLDEAHAPRAHTPDLSTKHQENHKNLRQRRISLWLNTNHINQKNLNLRASALPVSLWLR